MENFYYGKKVSKNLDDKKERTKVADKNIPPVKDIISSMAGVKDSARGKSNSDRPVNDSSRFSDHRSVDGGTPSRAVGIIDAASEKGSLNNFNSRGGGNHGNHGSRDSINKLKSRHRSSSITSNEVKHPHRTDFKVNNKTKLSAIPEVKDVITKQKITNK